MTARDELLQQVETCPFCGRKALENPTSLQEAVKGMREHMLLAHDAADVVAFNMAMSIANVMGLDVDGSRG